MRKRVMVPVLALLLMLLFTNALASGNVIDKSKNPADPFVFPDGAELMEIWFPQIYGCDAALVRAGGQAILIDAGKSDQADAVSDMLAKAGVTGFDYILNTHPDPDHVGGFFTIIKDYAITEALTGFPETVDDEPRQAMFLAKLAEAGIPARRVMDGETLHLGKAVMTVVQRYDAANPRINNNSVTLHIVYGASTAYFTGDIQMITQKALIADRDKLDIQSDLLKYPHHGLDRMQTEFLDMVSPLMVVATAGKGDPYTAKGKAQLKEYGVPEYFTSDGILRFTTDGETWVIERMD